jgi:hypothetical protein
LVFVVALALAASAAAVEQRDIPDGVLSGEPGVATANFGANLVTWSPNVPFERGVLTIVGRGDAALRREFGYADQISFDLTDGKGNLLPDGDYSFEVKLYQKADVEAGARRSAPVTATEEQVQEPEVTSVRASGRFQIVNGLLVAPATPEMRSLQRTSDAAPKVFDHTGDFSVSGKLLTGTDGIPIEDVHIQCDDQDGSCPAGIVFQNADAGTTVTAQQWAIQVSRDRMGFRNGATLDGTVVATMETGAPANSLYIDSTGRVGFGADPGTSTAPNRHLVMTRDGSFFDLVIENNAGDWWLGERTSTLFGQCISGSGAGYTCPVRIYEDAPSFQLNLTPDGIGIGTDTPDVQLDVRGQAQVRAPTGSGRLIFDTADPANDKFSFLLFRNTGVNGAGIIYRQSNADFYAYDYLNSHFIWRYRTGVQDFVIEDPSVNVGIGKNNPTQRLDVNGNIVASGTITPSSDVNAKTDFAEIDAMEVLSGIESLPVTAWRFKEEADGVRHIGPMAQDFKAAFGVGTDERHIATIDSDGVALAGLKALYSLVQELQAENQELRERLSRLEAQ